MGIDYSNNVGAYYNEYHSYPIMVKNSQIESGITRFLPFPTLNDFAEVAFMGLDRVSALVNEMKSNEPLLQLHLSNAVTQLEQELETSFSEQEAEKVHSYIYEHRYYDDQVPIDLNRFPVTAIMGVEICFPHALTGSPFFSREIPPSWIVLHRNKITMSPSIGAFLNKFAFNAYPDASPLYMTPMGNNRPMSIKVRFRYGFDSERLPANLVKLILDVATVNMLIDYHAHITPFNSTSVSIDGVSQSASLVGPQLLIQKIEMLQKVIQQQKQLLLKAHSKGVKIRVAGGK